MEHIAFLVDGSGDRIDCLLNPETLRVTRLAGVRPRGTAAGQLVGTGLADDPLLFTGGGRTEVVLDLLFDTDLVEESVRPADVRELTGRLWALAENSVEQQGSVRPPLVRLVWGKTWNVPGVIVSIAERFDAFQQSGEPRRSWLRLKLVRVAEPAAQRQTGFEQDLNAVSSPIAPPGSAIIAIGDGDPDEDSAGVRFDLLANEALGSPLRWRLLAAFNGITDPFAVFPGTALEVPPLTASSVRDTPEGTR